MIPRTLEQHTDWKSALRNAVTEPEELLALLDLPRSRWLNGARTAAALFPLKVPRGFIARMQKGNPLDPLLLQVLPLHAELEKSTGYSSDPVGDLAATAVAGLIHKYRNRALLIATGTCAINCRYCFRRHFPYSVSHAGGSRLDDIRHYLSAHQEIDEIILSGGDPLMLDDPQLSHLLNMAASFDHIQRIRIHTRLPVVLPERITGDLLTTLTVDKPVIMVIHCNHPNELDNPVIQALQHLHLAGIRMYNQSVLLRDINDTVETLCELSVRLFDARVQPYYLHCLDKVNGAAHFDVADDEARRLYRQIQAKLSGFLLPRLVRDIPDRPAKSLIF